MLLWHGAARVELSIWPFLTSSIAASSPPKRQPSRHPDHHHRATRLPLHNAHHHQHRILSLHWLKNTHRPLTLNQFCEVVSGFSSNWRHSHRLKQSQVAKREQRPFSAVLMTVCTTAVFLGWIQCKIRQPPYLVFHYTNSGDGGWIGVGWGWMVAVTDERKDAENLVNTNIAMVVTITIWDRYSSLWSWTWSLSSALVMTLTMILLTVHCWTKCLGARISEALRDIWLVLVLCL